MLFRSPSELKIAITAGLEGSSKIFIKEYTLNGTVQSPYACMLGEAIGQFNSISTAGAASSTGGGLSNSNSAIPSARGGRLAGIALTSVNGEFITSTQVQQ